MPVTHVAGTKAFRYLDNIGKIGDVGMSFFYPYGVARGKEDIIYVANWGLEFRPCARISKIKISTQEWLMDIGHPDNGKPDEEFLWPGHLITDHEENLHVTDQANHKIVSFTKNGEFISKWGTAGSNEGEFYRPSGIALDLDGNFVIADATNHRIQTYSPQGQYISQFGTNGSGHGQLQDPWGTFVDREGNIFVADWGNSRVQKFSAAGKFISEIGHCGSGQGELNHPSAVAIDKDGDIYIADWGNNRVVVYEEDGTFLVSINGDATNLSRWAEYTVLGSPDLKKALDRVDLEPMSRLWHPSALHVGDDYKIFIAEAQHQRIQIYEKEPLHQEAQFTL